VRYALNKTLKYKCIDEELDVKVEKKAEYCNDEFFRIEDYLKRFECLENENIQTDTEKCRVQNTYLKYYLPSNYSKEEEVSCYKGIGFPLK